MREKLIEVLETVVSPNELLCCGEVLVTTSRVADHLIANDVVPVVRCKDCEHCIWDEEYNEWECVRSADFNDETGQWYGVIEFVEEVHFCSYGERKDNGSCI